MINELSSGLKQAANDMKEQFNAKEAKETAAKELGKDGRTIEKPDLNYMERHSRLSLLEAVKKKVGEAEGLNEANQNLQESDDSDDVLEKKGLTEEEKAKIKEQTGWSDEIIDNIKNWEQYKALRKAGLIEAEINGKKCLIKENIDLDAKDADGISNHERMERGLAPVDANGNPIELHHLGQKADSPLVELTVEEHRTGDYVDGKKNQSLWHDNDIKSEVHTVENGAKFDAERSAHWQTRIANS